MLFWYAVCWYAALVWLLSFLVSCNLEAATRTCATSQIIFCLSHFFNWGHHRLCHATNFSVCFDLTGRCSRCCRGWLAIGCYDVVWTNSKNMSTFRTGHTIRWALWCARHWWRRPQRHRNLSCCQWSRDWFPRCVKITTLKCLVWYFGNGSCS